MEERTLAQLRQMLRVEVEKVEQSEGGFIVYVPKGQVAKAIGKGGCVARAAEMVLGKKLTIKESG